jgi:hypothetical protein
MGTSRGLPPELLETLSLEPEGDEDEPDEPTGPYELAHRIAEFSPPKEWPVPATTGRADQRRAQRRRASHKSGRAPPAGASGDPRVACSLFRSVLALEDAGSSDLCNATSGQASEANLWIEVSGPEPEGPAAVRDKPASDTVLAARWSDTCAPTMMIATRRRVRSN